MSAKICISDGMRTGWRLRALVLGACAAVACAAYAQDAKEIVQKAVEEEMTASKADHSLWRYRDDHKDADTIFIVVDTAHGSVKQLVERNGRPLSDEETKTEEQKVQSFIHSPSQQHKQEKDNAQDDKNAADLLKLLPRAFTWKIVSDNGDLTTLHFDPDPSFDAPDIKSRVLGAMAGEMVIDKKGHRIRTIKGELTEDVSIGWGILGKLHKGGTFNVERREIAPGIWQIVQTHVHIQGKALFFKSIGQQQDEIESDFKEVPRSTTLEEAAEMLKTAASNPSSASQ